MTNLKKLWHAASHATSFVETRRDIGAYRAVWTLVNVLPDDVTDILQEVRCRSTIKFCKHVRVLEEHFFCTQSKQHILDNMDELLYGWRMPAGVVGLTQCLVCRRQAGTGKCGYRAIATRFFSCKAMVCSECWDTFLGDEISGAVHSAIVRTSSEHARWARERANRIIYWEDRREEVQPHPF